VRLGGHFFVAGSVDDLDPLCERLDKYGLSAVPGPAEMRDWTKDACAAYGEEARRLGVEVGEVGYWKNLLTPDGDLQAERVGVVRRLLIAAEAMGCRCVVTLVGTKDPSDRAVAPHPYLKTDECRREFRDLVLRILDGLDLSHARYVIEPWHNTFFYQPEDIRAFIDTVDHPAFGLHLDQVNMVSPDTYFGTGALVRRTFDLLADEVASVHLKDIRCDPTHAILKYDEVLIGDGGMDYETYLEHLAGLDPDMPCYCEHLASEEEYAENFRRVRGLAEKAGVRFLRRGETAD
jgi:sugar phosphate isomerase/epimerase